MKLLWFLTWREVRTHWQNLLPFLLIAAALFFTASAQITLQECVDFGEETFDYMSSPTYMLLLTAFALIGFATAKTFFLLYSESQLNETGIKRALGLKRRDLRSIRLLLGFLCVTVSAVIAVPLALLYMYLFVRSCASGNMLISDFTPLVYRIPYSNLLRTLLLLIPAMMCGVLFGAEKEKSIVSLLQRGKISSEPENGNGSLPDGGNLRNYGRLFVRRSIKRCIRYNLITVFLLILPMFYLLGASTNPLDYSNHSFELHSVFIPETITFSEITETTVSEISEIPGVSEAVIQKSERKGYRDHLLIYAGNEADFPELREQILQYAAEHSLKFEDTVILRAENNAIARHYQFFFITHAVILFAVVFLSSITLLKSRLSARKRELSILRALGARTDTIVNAVIPETTADCISGSVFSVILGGLTFFSAMMDGGGTVEIFSIIFLCCLFLSGNIWVQILASKQITRKILSETTERL